jgi:peptidoglycan/LPS O-acetylase OafA/YrhL
VLGLMGAKVVRYGSRAHLPALTGVRAFAALLVLALHGSQNFPNPPVNGFALVQHGYLGVDLFFILSGFIIAHVYGRHIVPLRIEHLQIFLWHRFIRLYPAHATVLIALVGLIVTAQHLGIPLSSDAGWNFRDLPWHFLMLHAWGFTETASWNAPSWSISAEWFAYLVFPAAALAVSALTPRASLALAVMPLIVLAAVIEASGSSIASAFTGFPALARVECEFVCGMLIQCATARSAALWLSERMADLFAAGGLFGFIVAASLDAPDSLLILLLAVLIFGLARAGPVGRALFARPSVVWVGEISYSIYLVHFPVLLVLRHGSDKLHLISESATGSTVAFLIANAVVIAAACVLFYAIEDPARRRLRNVFGTIGPVSDVTQVPKIN